MNLVDALNQAGIPWKPHKSREGEIYLCCPFCTERHESADYRFRLSVNYITGMGHCYNCEWSSRDSLRSLEYMLKIGQLDTAEMPGISQRRPEKTELPMEYVTLEDVTSGDGPFWDIKKYLLKRGITEEQIKEKEIGGAVEGRYRYSAIFPVYYGKIGLCGWISRDITNARLDSKGKPLRYLNSEGVKVAYNVPYPMPENSTVVVTEGVIKALAVERVIKKVYNWFSISVQGSSMSNTQLAQLENVKEVIIFADPGTAGRTKFLSMWHSIEHLFDRASLAYPLPDKQADELTPKEIFEHLRNRKPYSPGLEMQLKSKEIFGAYK